MGEVFDRLKAALADRYVIEREIGAGGMATVYLAKDLRHNRWVALKVLRPELAAILGTDRFLSEIEVTANLQHPHLLPLFDSGEADGHLFYVMPFVEGESLRARLDRERQLPVDEAVELDSAIAAALDYAHRHGVIHRDLKPENILLHDGQPLVADFGIALAVSNAGGARVTQTGLSLGTPAYMSPEQATGDRAVDARADIYSLGALTYEMLTGEPPHVASTSQAMIAKLLTEPPQSVRVLRPSVREHVAGAVEKALAKLPADRFTTAGEFAEAVKGIRIVAPGVEHTSGASIRGTKGELVSWRRIALWVSTTAIVTAVLVFALTIRLDSSPPPPVMRFPISLPVGESVGPGVAISADGRYIVYVVTASGMDRLYVRATDALTATPIEGTEGARNPFFSPDGRWIGYGDGGALRKIPTTGGPSVVVVPAVGGLRGASWASDGTIVYATDYATGLLSVPADGGEPKVLTTPDRARGEISHALPEVLPGGRAVLFTVLTAEGSRIEALDLSSGERKVLVQGGSQPRFASSGHLIYAAQSNAGGTLQAVPFDPRTASVTGDPLSVAEGLLTKAQAGVAYYAVSATGELVYLSGADVSVQSTLVWVDRGGREEPLGAPPRAYMYPRLSPDGTRVAVNATDREQDIWVWDLTRKTLTRLTLNPALDNYPVWTPDGRRLVFASQREETQNLYEQAADGTGPVEKLTDGGELRQSTAFTPNGGALVFRQVNEGMAGDLYLMDVAGRDAKPLVATPADESNADLSPDGRWLAYQSNESGRNEIYVRPFPDVDVGRWQVSTEGGTRPLWAPGARELFYLAPDGRLTSVEVASSGATFTSGTPRRIHERAYLRFGAGRTYDVAPDGRRFLMVKEADTAEAEAPEQLVIVINWLEELKR